MKFSLLLCALLVCSCTVEQPPPLSGSLAQPPVVEMKPVVETDPVADDPDDPAVWIHPTDPERSILIGTNKVQAPSGALVAFGLDGKVLQSIGNLDRPNNVDVEHAVLIDGKNVDIAVVAERNAHAVRIFSIDRTTRQLSEMRKIPVFEGETGEASEPMGIAIYKRPDHAVFIVVGRKSGPLEGYLWQYRLTTGTALQLVRKFGSFSGAGEIEAIAIDDALGYVYYADESAGIRKYHADPNAGEANRELALFGRSGYRGDREGIAIYSTDARSGYVVSTDQIAGGSRYLLYRREGTSGDPHDHQEVVGVFENGADETDGIEVVSLPISETFPHGFLAAMNSGPRSFLLFAWPNQWSARGSR